MEIAARLKGWRERAGLGQSEVAERIGVTRAAVGHYERGARPLTIETISSWAKACGVEADLIEKDEKPEGEALPMADLRPEARDALMQIIRLLPPAAPDPSETAELAAILRALPPQQRTAMLRLGRLFPRLPEALRDDLVENVERWSERYGEEDRAHAAVHGPRGTPLK